MILASTRADGEVADTAHLTRDGQEAAQTDVEDELFTSITVPGRRRFPDLRSPHARLVLCALLERIMIFRLLGEDEFQSRSAELDGDSRADVVLDGQSVGMISVCN